MYTNIEVHGETLEIPFQTLEIQSFSRRRDVPKKEKSALPWEKMSKLIKSRDTLGQGKLLEIPKKKDRFGMGYKPANIESRKINQRKFRTLQNTFHIVGYKNEDHVAAIEEEEEGIPNLVCHCLPDTTLNNWKAIEIPEMISISK